MTIDAVVPFMTASLLRKTPIFSSNININNNNNNVNSEDICTPPLVPAVTLLNTFDRKPVRKWSLERRNIGFQWQPENTAFDSLQTFNGEGGRGESLSSLPSPLLPFTNEEYDKYLTSPAWSREETEYLFDLLQQYHYRFITVADRYNYKQQQQQRSLEDIKERYYKVIGRLREVTRNNNNNNNNNIVNDAAVKAFVYDKEGDRHRRMVLQNLYNKELESKESRDEEALLTRMMLNLRLVLPKVLQEREKLLLCCGSLGQHLLAHAPTLPELCGGLVKASRRSSASGAPIIAIDSGPKTTKKKSSQKKRTAAITEKKRRVAGIKTDGDMDMDDEGLATVAANTTDSTTPAHNGPGRKPKPSLAHTFVRSSGLKPIRVGLTRHVDKLLLEMALRPTMPTVAVCEKFNELRLLLARLGEAQKAASSSLSASGTPVASQSGIASHADDKEAESPITGMSRKSSRSTSPLPPTGEGSSPMPSGSITRQPAPKRPK